MVDTGRGIAHMGEADKVDSYTDMGTSAWLSLALERACLPVGLGAEGQTLRQIL